jgi:hypothetical protein
MAKKVNPAAAGVAGAAIGAAVAGAAVALSDKRNRKKVGVLAKKLKIEGQKAAASVKKEAQRLKAEWNKEDVEGEIAAEPKEIKGKTVKEKKA